MKSHNEIQDIHGLAIIAETLLATQHPEAHDAAMPIVELIKQQFQPVTEQSQEAAAPQEWDGISLPPVGTVCIFDTRVGDEDWCWSKNLKKGMVVEVLAHYQPTHSDLLVAVFAYGNKAEGQETAQAVASCFKPLLEDQQSESSGQDPLAAAVEDLRRARAEVDRLASEYSKASLARDGVDVELDRARRAARDAEKAFDEAIKASNNE